LKEKRKKERKKDCDKHEERGGASIQRLKIAGYSRPACRQLAQFFSQTARKLGDDASERETER